MIRLALVLAVVALPCQSKRVDFKAFQSKAQLHSQEVPKGEEAAVRIDVTVDSDIEAGRHEYYQTWAKKAYKWLDAAIARLAADRRRNAKSLMVKWFSLEKLPAEWDNVEEQVKKRLIAMQKAITDLYIQKGTECDVRKQRGGAHGTLAYVYKGAKHGSSWVINVCEYAKGFDGDVSTRTLIHEVAHHMGTDDHAYGKKDCLKLPAQQAVQNADTYALLVDLLRKEKNLYIEGSGVPHLSCNTVCDSDEFDSHKLNALPPLGNCLQCSWNYKASGLAGTFNSVFGGINGTETDFCGSGLQVATSFASGDCEDHGCEWVDNHRECLKASQALGLGFAEVNHKAYDAHAPYACHASGGHLLFNRNLKSEAKASPSDKMICMCPSPEEYAETKLSYACCTAYECERPSK